MIWILLNNSFTYVLKTVSLVSKNITIKKEILVSDFYYFYFRAMQVYVYK